MQGVCSEKLNPDPIRTALDTFSEQTNLESDMLPPTVGTLIHGDDQNEDMEEDEDLDR